MKFNTVRLLVKDFAAAHHFYHSVLGFKPRFGGPDGDYEEFDTGSNVCIALFKYDLMYQAIGETPAPISGNRLVLTFEVENVDLAAEILVSRGVTAVSKPTDHPAWHLRAAHFRDPDGNLIELSSPLKPAK